MSDWDHLESAFVVGAGMPSITHVPVPGQPGLTVGLWTRDPHWRNPNVLDDFRRVLHELGITRDPPNIKGSTSTLFMQSANGKKVLRLDWGVLPDGTVTYHWNRSKIPVSFTGVTNHQAASAAYQNTSRAMRVFRHAGRGLLVLGVAMDAYSIYTATDRPRQATRVISGWAGATAGCRIVGAGGAWAGGAIGSAGAGVGAAPGAIIGGIGGCLVGGIGGYWVGSELGEAGYEWAEDTFFTKAPTGKVDEFLSGEPATAE